MADVASEKFGIIRRIWLKVKYGTVIQEGLERFGKLGFKLELYYLFMENGLSPGISIPPLETEGFETGFLGPGDMMAVAGTPWGGVTEKQVKERFEKGRMCFGAKKGGKVLSYVWCNFEECRYLSLRIPLRENEVYLYNTQTLRSYRGKNLAGLVRNRLYTELAGRRQTRLYSVVSVFNGTSLRFKHKMSAQAVSLYLSIGLMNRWERTYRLKTYSLSN
jgi:hypothetical protein